MYIYMYRFLNKIAQRGKSIMYYTRLLLACLISLYEKSIYPPEILSEMSLAVTLPFCIFLVLTNYLLICSFWYLFQILFQYIISRTICLETKLRLAQVSGRVFQVVFTYYRLSRAFLLHMIIPDMSKVVRMVMPRKYYNKFCKLPEDIIPLIQERLQLPWLMLRSHPFSVEDHSFFSLSEERFYKLCPPLMSRRNCVGSIEGWLIMVDNVLWRPEGFMNPWSFYLLFNQTCTSNIPTVNYFLNPMSGARVDLPSQSTIPCHNSDQASFFRKVIASSAPTGNCLVAALCSNGRLVFCRPSAKSWTLIEEKGHHERLNFVDVEIIDGKLYGATKQASKFLAVIDIQDGNADGHPTYTVEGLIMLQPWPVPLRMVSNKASSRVYTRHVLERIHLAKDSTSNDLFLILRKNSYVLENDPAIPWSVIIGDENFNSPPRTRGFRVLKLENGTPGHAEWVEIDNLGDRIIFLSEAANKIVAVNNGLDYDHRAEILEGNCIYYAYDNPYLSSPSFDTFCKRNFASPARELDVGVFSLAEKKTRSLNNFSKDYFRSKLHTRPLWFCPS